MNLLGKKKEPQPTGIAALVDSLAKEMANERYPMFFSLSKTKVGKSIAALKPAELRQYVLCTLDYLEPLNKQARSNPSADCVRRAMLEVLRKKMPFTEAEVCRLLDWSLAQDANFERGIPQMIKAIDDFLKANALTDGIQERARKLAKLLDKGRVTAEDLRYQARLRDLTAEEELIMPLVAGEAWTDSVIAEVAALPEPAKKHWLQLFDLCAKASGSSPTEKWRKSAEVAVDALGFDVFKAAVLRWFPLVDKPRPENPERRRLEPLSVDPVNADLLRALVWMCALREDREVARSLTALALSTYRKLPGFGPRASKVGNACVWALGSMPGSDAGGQLAVLKVRVKFISAQKAIEAALSAAAKRLNLPAEEIEEMSVPSYGLEEVGTRREEFGEYRAELVVDGSDAELRWFGPGGKKLSAAPKAAKEAFGEEIKALAQAKKDIEKMLPAQSARIEGLYLEQKDWKLPVWRERYLDHPLVGTLARRLIWKFSRGDRAASGILWEGQIVDAEGRLLDWLDEETRVELWHPIFVSAEVVLAWRAWLEQHAVRQPFKQAHREIYLLTAAEEETRVYSNRFAAHILKQHQFNALCGARGWRNKLRLMVDDDYPPASRPILAHNLRAEFWIEGIGDTYGADTTDSGSYLYLSTDQVRFYPLDARQHYAHASGGGYRIGRNPPEPIPLDQIPALVFSEIMRDVDLFVGVASIGSDPNWLDGGRDQPYQDYWSRYSFGVLSVTAQMRKQTLERLIPRLKMAPRCTFADRYLVVRGDLRTYKIHLGSGNILMEPNDQYLCIVPARGAGSAVGERIYLPFEGDQLLSVILSKAMMLAEDTKITDPTIVRQIKR